jgi:hypothetical protein
MIKSDFELKQARKCIALLEAAVEDQRRNVLPKSKEWFDLMTEHSLDEIKHLQAEVDKYLAQHTDV